MGAPEQPGRAHCRGQRVPPARVGGQSFDRVQLAHRGVDGAAEVGGLGIEGAVDPGTNVAHHASLLEGQPAALGADRAEGRSHRLGAAHRDHRSRPAHAHRRRHLEDLDSADQPGAIALVQGGLAVELVQPPDQTLERQGFQLGAPVRPGRHLGQ